MLSSEDYDIGIAVALYLVTGEKTRKQRFQCHPINKEKENRGIMSKLYPQLRDNEDKFYNYTRMSRAAFEELLCVVQDEICVTYTNFQKSISPQERLLLTIWWVFIYFV